MHPELTDPRPDIRWITAHLPQFVPATASVPARGVTKRCAELAMTCSYLRMWVRHGSLPAAPFAAQLDAWQAMVQRRCEDLAVRRRALEDPDAALFHAQPYLWLRVTGYRSGAWEDALSELAADGVRPTSMGVLHLLWKAGLMRDQPDWRRALAVWLAAWGDRSEPWDHNAYRITHAAFYISDLGNEAPAAEPDDHERLVAHARRLLRRSVARRRWDLTGELLTAVSCLDGEDALHRSATRAFCASWRQQLAADSGGTGDLGHGRPDPDEAFRRKYHTAIVDLLRCAVTVRSEAVRSRPQLAAGRAP